MSVLAARIDAFTEAPVGVVVVQRLRIGTVAVTEQLAVQVPTQVLGLVQRIGDTYHPTFGVVLVVGLAAQRIRFPEQVAVGIVTGAVRVPRTIADFDRQGPVPQVADVFATPQWIARLDQAANFIVAVVSFAALWIDTLHQLTGDDFLLPAIAKGVYVLVDLIERPPVVMVLATEAVGDAGFAFFQVVLEAVGNRTPLLD